MVLFSLLIRVSGRHWMPFPHFFIISLFLSPRQVANWDAPLSTSVPHFTRPLARKLSTLLLFMVPHTIQSLSTGDRERYLWSDPGFARNELRRFSRRWFSPTLFNRHKNSLRSVNDCILLQYAEDKAVCSLAPSYTTSLPVTLQHVASWVENNSLFVSGSKCVDIFLLCAHQDLARPISA